MRERIANRKANRIANTDTNDMMNAQITETEAELYMNTLQLPTHALHAVIGSIWHDIGKYM